MTVPPSPYAVLGVGPDATPAAVARAHQEALRARPHDRAAVTRAFEQLRDPRHRLAADLLEPPPEPADDAPEPPPRPAGEAPPLPDWTDLVVPAAAVVPPQEVAPPPGEFRAPESPAPSGVVVPPPAFPV